MSFERFRFGVKADEMMIESKIIDKLRQWATWFGDGVVKFNDRLLNDQFPLARQKSQRFNVILQRSDTVVYAVWSKLTD